jgi:carbamoyl-phosphate synthase large subunit
MAEKDIGSKKINANVLVTAAGGIVGQGIIKCLKMANASLNAPVKYRITATDMNGQAAGLYRCDDGILVPPSSASNFIDVLIEIARQQDIDAIYVGSDEELLIIGNSARRIEDETKAKVISCPPKVLMTSRDKWKTFEFLKANNLPCAASSLPEDSESLIREHGFPIVVKPREGYGSLHFYLVNNKDEMEYAISKIERIGWSPLLQEYLNGKNLEFTSGVTIDRFGKCVMSSISIQKTIKRGQTYKALIDYFENIRKSAEELALKMGAKGAINVQARIEEGIPKTFEVNPRFSATCPMRSAAGVNEPDIVYRNVVLDEELKIDGYKRLLCMRYWNEVYIPYSTYEKTLSAGRVKDNDSFIISYF